MGPGWRVLGRRCLGATGILVSPLGLGTVKFGRNTGVKYPEAFLLPSDAEIDVLLAVAREEGVNLIDTAPAYGESEVRVGRAIAGCRDEWVLVTKAGESFDGVASGFDFSRRGIDAGVSASLRRLRVEAIDVVLLHSDGIVELGPGLHEALDALAAWKTKGHVRAVGVSSKTVEGGLRAVSLHASGLCDVVMVTLNDMERADETVIRAASLAGVGVLVKKAMGSGHRPDLNELRRTAHFPGVSATVVGTLKPHNLRSNCRAVGEGPEPAG